jgi:hypothetical protein
MSDPAQHSVGPQLRFAVHRKQGKNRGQTIAFNRCADFYRLFDYVYALGLNPLAEEPSRDPFAGAVFSNHPRSAGQPSGQGRTNCALQVDANIVALGSQ